MLSACRICPDGPQLAFSWSSVKECALYELEMARVQTVDAYLAACQTVGAAMKSPPLIGVIRISQGNLTKSFDL